MVGGHVECARSAAVSCVSIALSCAVKHVEYVYSMVEGMLSWSILESLV